MEIFAEYGPAPTHQTTPDTDTDTRLWCLVSGCVAWGNAKPDTGWSLQRGVRPSSYISGIISQLFATPLSDDASGQVHRTFARLSNHDGDYKNKPGSTFF